MQYQKKSWIFILLTSVLLVHNSQAADWNNVVGIFSENGKVRLDIGIRAMKEEVPASHDSWATRLRIVPLNQLALGQITYGTVVGIFSETKQVRLDIGIRAVKERVPASHDSWATRLKIRKQ